MARAQIKIVVFVFAVAFLTASVLVAVYYFEKEYIPHAELQKEIEAIEVDAPALPDPAKRDFAAAVALLEEGDIEAAREGLLDVMAAYPESPRVDDARRVVGEINMDQLLSRSPMPGKLDYRVKSGDALAAIARKNWTTMEYISFVNGVEGTTIHPGDRLVLFPLEFDVEIDLGAGTLTLLHGGEFFKFYPVVEYSLSPAVRVPSTLKVTAKSAWVGDERLSATDPRLVESTKWIQCSAGGAVLGLVVASADRDEAARERLPHGVFIADADMEELFTILRVGRIVRVVR